MGGLHTTRDLGWVETQRLCVHGQARRSLVSNYGVTIAFFFCLLLLLSPSSFLVLFFFSSTRLTGAPEPTAALYTRQPARFLCGGPIYPKRKTASTSFSGEALKDPGHLLCT